MANDAYMICSSTSPDVLDVYANATLIGRATSELAVTNANLLIHFDGTDGQTTYTTEDYGARTVSFFNSAQLDTATPKYGASSLLLAAATKDYVTLPDSDDFDFGVSNFTIHFWVYPTNADWSGYKGYMGTDHLPWVDDVLPWVIYTYQDAQVKVTITHANYVLVSSGDQLLTLNAWNHVAFQRKGQGAEDMNIAINGVWGNAPTNGGTSINSAGFGLAIGRFYTNYDGYYPNGSIDEVIISPDALWTSGDFTPPTSTQTASETGDTYMTCSSTNPDVLDTYVDGVLVGRVTSETATTGASNTYIDCDTPDKLRIYVDETLILEAEDL